MNTAYFQSVSNQRERERERERERDREREREREKGRCFRRLKWHSGG
jgi:hypothetical protein